MLREIFLWIGLWAFKIHASIFFLLLHCLINITQNDGFDQFTCWSCFGFFSLIFFFVFFWLRFQVYFVEICFGKLVTSLTWYVVLFDIYVFFLTCPSWYGLLYTVITKQTFLLFHCWLTDGRYLLSKISTSVYYYHPIWMPGEAGSMIISCLTGGVLTSWSLHKEHTETLHCIYVYIERDWTCVLLTFWFMARFTWTGAKYMYMSNLVMDLYEFFVKRMWFRGSVIIL